MEDDPKIELESAALSLITAPFVLSCVSTIPPFQRSIELKQPVPGFGFETNPTAFEVPSIFGNLQIFRFARMRKPTPEGVSGAELESSWSSL